MNNITAPRIADLHSARLVLLDKTSCHHVSTLLPAVWETVDRIKHNEIACTLYTAIVEDTVDRFNASTYKTLAGLECVYSMLLTCAALDRKVNIK